MASLVSRPLSPTHSHGNEDTRWHNLNTISHTNRQALVTGDQQTLMQSPLPSLKIRKRCLPEWLRQATFDPPVSSVQSRLQRWRTRSPDPWFQMYLHPTWRRSVHKWILFTTSYNVHTLSVILSVSIRETLSKWHIFCIEGFEVLKLKRGQHINISGGLDYSVFISTVN